jgi:hypothetical protein
MLPWSKSHLFRFTILHGFLCFYKRFICEKFCVGGVGSGEARVSRRGANLYLLVVMEESSEDCSLVEENFTQTLVNFKNPTLSKIVSNF